MVSRRGRGFRTALTAFVAAAPVVLLVPLLAGCPFPLTQVDRPEYNNPVDPGARVPIRDVLPLIPDAAFRDAVIASGVRYNTDLETLWAEDAGIADLTGIQYLPRLRELSLPNVSPTGGNAVTSLEPLRGHPSLEYLALSNEGGSAPTHLVTDYSPLADVPNLRRLDLSYMSSAGQDFAVAGFVPQLEELRIRGWDLTGVASVPTIAGLRRLDVSDATGFSDLSPFSFPSLEELDVWNSQLNDLSGGSGIATLRRLSVGSAGVMTSLNGLATFAALQELDVGNSPNITDLSGLSALGSTLRYLNADNLPTAAYGTLPSLAVLEELHARGAYSDAASLQDLVSQPALRRLYTSPNTTLSDLSDFLNVAPPASLEEFGFELDANLTFDPDLQQLSGWPVAELRINDASTTKTVLNISALSSSPVRRLELTNLGLTDTSAVQVAQAVPYVEFLSLANNPNVTSAAPFQSLTFLRELDLSVATSPTGIGADPLINGIPGLAALPDLYQVYLTNTAAGGDPAGSGIDQLTTQRPDINVVY